MSDFKGVKRKKADKPRIDLLIVGDGIDMTVSVNNPFGEVIHSAEWDVFAPYGSKLKGQLTLVALPE